MLRLILQDVPKAPEDEENSKQGPRAHEGKEVSIVSSSHAIVDPYAMVVLGLYAIVTYSAVVTPWRSPNVTGLAILGWDVHSCVSSPS